MKAPDIVESWLWQPPEEIIERLLERSSRTIGLPVKAKTAPRKADRYSRYWTVLRQRRIRQAMREARW